MSKPIPFFAESLNTLKHMLGYGFMYDLRKQVRLRDFNLEEQGSASATDEPPKHIDSVTNQVFDSDSHKYLEHISKTVDKALSTGIDADKHQYELTRIIDNPYSLLVFFKDSTEEKNVLLSLLHHSASNGNTEAMNELVNFYAPPNDHHKYAESAYSNHKTALKLLTKSCNLGSSISAAQLAEIYEGKSHIQGLAPDKEMALAMRELEDEWRLKAKTNKTIAPPDHNKKQVSTYLKAKAWYEQALNSGTGQPLKHVPLNSVSKYYKLAEQGGDLGTPAEKYHAIAYLKTQTQNRLPYQADGKQIAEAMFDLGVMYKLGINGLEIDHVEAGSLLSTAGIYDINVRREIKAMSMDDAPNLADNMPEPQIEPAKKIPGPRFG